MLFKNQLVCASLRLIRMCRSFRRKLEKVSGDTDGAETQRRPQPFRHGPHRGRSSQSPWNHHCLGLQGQTGHWTPQLLVLSKQIIDPRWSRSGPGAMSLANPNRLLPNSCQCSACPEMQCTESANPQTPSQLWAFSPQQDLLGGPSPSVIFYFSLLYPFSYKIFLPSTPFCSYPKEDSPLHEVLNKVYLYDLDCFL